MGVRIFGIAGSSNPAEDFRLAASGLYVPAPPLNKRTGVTSAPVLTGTGSLTCTVGPFSCLVDGTSNSLQGSYWATLDSATTVTITTGATQQRIDLISLQIQDNAYDGSGAQAGRILYTAGTPGSGSAPTAPANSISLFTVTVPANATTLNFSTAATSVFPYTAAAGGIVPVRSASDKPAVASAVQYRHRLDVAAGSGASPLEWSTDGTTYTPAYDPNAAYGAWTNAIVNGAAFSALAQPQYRTAPGGRIELRGSVQATIAPSTNTTVLSSLPAPGNVRELGAATDATALYIYIGTSSTSATITGFTGTVPLGTNIGFDGLSYTI